MTLSVSPPTGTRVRTDDMHDGPEEIPGSQPLRDALRLCEELVTPAFDHADRAARHHQSQHRVILTVAAICGTLAILFAILQLSDLIRGDWLIWVEVIAAIGAVASVALGLLAARHPHWLLARHRAERLRALKFRFLIDPVLWSGDPLAIQARFDHLREEVGEIQRITHESLHHWVEDDAPDVPLTAHAHQHDHKQAIGEPSLRMTGDIADLVAYYQKKRLKVQMDFFAYRAQSNVRLDRSTRHLPPAFFFLSIMAALGHFVYDIIAHGTGQAAHDTDHAAEVASAAAASPVSLGLIVLAAALPVLGAGVRTLRTSQEFARNMIRYRAKHLTLYHVAERLPAETNPAAILHELAYAEQVIESEHREWLRLMVEAEWFG